MRKRTIALLAVLSAFWIFGLLDQMYSLHATMRYLALSLVLVAIGVWRWRPRPKRQPVRRDPPPPQQ